MFGPDFAIIYQNAWWIITKWILPQILFIIAISTVLTFLGPKVLGRYIEKFTVLFLFGTFGTVVGFLTGASRESAVGSVLPVLVTTVVTYIGYLTTSKISKEYRMIVPFCVITLLLSTLFSALFGTYFRLILLEATV